MVIVLFLSHVTVDAQILRNKNSLILVKECIDNIYNLRFRDAEGDCNKLDQTYPGHPVVYLLRGMLTYWEYYPLIPSSPSRSLFESNMRKCIELTEAKKDPVDDAELLLADLSARGMLLLYYADNNLSMDVIPLATSTYQYIRRSFDYTSVYSDFFFFTGLYNYYREAYPEVYPLYRVIAFLFPKGDRLKGIDELQRVAQNSILFKAESSLFLSGIYQSFEYNFMKAFDYSKWLHELYPGNYEYLAMYIKNLLLIRQYDEAESHINAAADVDCKYFKAQLSIFSGIIQEKKYHNNILAEQYYKSGISELAVFGHYGNEFSAYGLFGLSRISDSNGDINNKKTYHKKASELADFAKIDFN
jgi:hypothetical protein